MTETTETSIAETAKITTTVAPSSSTSSSPSPALSLTSQQQQLEEQQLVAGTIALSVAAADNDNDGDDTKNKFKPEIDMKNNKNKNSVHCQFCNLIMFKPQLGSYVENEFNLPLMHQKKKQTAAVDLLETELLRDYWQINDMFTFENIGFSHTVGNTKYLICADCDMGPVGYHDVSSKQCFIALKRVKHHV